MKALIEKRNDLVDKMANIVDNAEKAGRAVTDEEKAQFDACVAEIANIDATLEMKDRVKGADKIAVEVRSVEDREKKEFVDYIRQVKNTDTPMTFGENGAVIPRTIADRIISIVYAICPIFERSEKYRIKGNLTIPAEDASNTNLIMDYADEFSADPDSTKVTLKSINLGEFLGRALCKVSRSLINNAQFDIVAYVVNRMALAISRFIVKELLNGTNQKVEGLRGVTQTMQTSATGASATDVTAISGDDLIDLQESILDEFQDPCIWIMSRNTRKAIRKLKDEIGHYLLNRDLTQKWGYELLGRPVYTTDNLADGIVYYGDMTGLATKISEDMSMQVLYEKYAPQHAVGILAFMGFDAKVKNPQKISKLTVKTN